MRRAMCIGFGRFDDQEIPFLPSAEPDAMRFFERITTPSLGGADLDSSVLLLSPTRSELRDRFSSFRASIAEGDVCVLFIAGHASHLRSGKLAIDCRDTQSKARTLTAFVEDDLHRFISSVGKARHIVILDTCFSGSIADELRARSESDATPFIKPKNDGVTYIWASGTRDLAFEKDGSGIFTGLLIKAMEHGADVPSYQRDVSAADAVDWVRKTLALTSYPRQFWPGIASAGNVERLFLCSNPFFNSIEAPSEDGSRTLRSEIDAAFRRVNSPPDEKRERLARHGEEFALRGHLSKAAKGDVLQISITRAVFNTITFIALGVIGILFFREIFGAIVGNILSVIYVVAAFSVVCNLYGKIKYKKHNFLLATPDGFVFSRTIYPETTKDVVLWSEVVEIEHELKTGDNGEYSEKIECKLEWPRSIVFKDDEIDYPGGLHAVGEFFRRNIALSRTIAPSARILPTRKIGTQGANGSNRLIGKFLVVGVSSYEHMPFLTSPACDAEAISDALCNLGVASIERSDDCSLEEFEASLLNYLQSCPGEEVGVYFSGHGVPVPGDLVLCLRDTTIDTSTETGLLVSRIPDLVQECRVRHLFLILDCCFSGAAGAGVSMTIDAARTLKNLLGPDSGFLTIFASVDAESKALAVKGQVSFFTSALIQAASDMRHEEVPMNILALGDATGQLLNRDGLSPHLQFSSENSSSIYLSDEVSNPLLDHAQQISDEQGKLLQDQFEMASNVAAQGLIEKIRDTHGNLLGEMFIRPEVHEHNDYRGCATVVGIPAIIVIFVALAAGQFAGAAMVVFVWVVLAFFGAALTGTRGKKIGFIFVAREGLILDDGTTVPWVDVADISLHSHSYTEEGSSPKQKYSLVLVDRHGESRVLCGEDEVWSMGKAQMRSRLEELRCGW